MNNQRRKAIQKVMDGLQELNNMVEELLADEQDAFESMPEGLQNSERGEASKYAAENLESAMISIEASIEELQSALD